MDLYLSNLNFNLGEIKPIQGLDRDSKYIDFLNSIGLKSYSESSCNEFELAYKPARNSLKEHIEPSLVIYSSDSLDTHENQKNHFSKLMCDLKIAEVYPIGHFLFRCSNLSSSITTAVNLMNSNSTIDSILIILSDKIQYGQKRISTFHYIASDSAASFILSRERTHKSFKIIHINEHADHSIQAINPKKTLIKYLNKTEENIKKVCQLHFNTIKYKTSDYGKFICGNYNLNIMKNYTKYCGFKEYQLFTNALEKYAHTFSSNHIICLKELIPKLKNNDKIFLLTTGDLFFGSISLKFCN